MEHSRNRMTALPLAACSIIAVGAYALSGASGCAHNVEVQPIKVEPIHMTLDINIKVDRELDEFFEEVEEAEQDVEPSEPTTAPAPAR